MHAEKEGYESVLTHLSVCHVFVFLSSRKQILFINISHAFFTIIFSFSLFLA